MNRMRPVVYLITICLLTPISGSAVTYYMACAIAKAETTVLYSSIVRVEFGDDDPPYKLVAGTYGVKGTTSFSEYWEEWVGKPFFGSSVDLVKQGWYDISATASTGGCDTPSIFVGTSGGGQGEVEGAMICWSPWICYLSVYINTDGFTTTSPERSGNYACFTCVPLTATPYDGFEWRGWTGDVNSLDLAISVCMGGAPKSVTANFAAIPSPPPPPDNQCGEYCGCNPNCSPIIINFQNGAYKLTGADDPVLFDISASGTPRRIGWTAADTDEAFLWRDTNRNGMVDSGAELFGTAMSLKSGDRAPNGFEALKEFDDNHDGMIDEHDAIWGELLLWRDLNHDGISQLNEVQPITLSNVTAITLDYHWTGRRDAYGNFFKYEAKVWLKSSHGQAEAAQPKPLYDIFFVSVK